MAITLSPAIGGGWPKKFAAALKSIPNAAESLRLLEKDRVNSCTLISFLYEYTHPDSVKRQRALRAWARGTVRLLAKSEKLMVDAVNRLSARPGLPISGETGFETDALRSYDAAIQNTHRLIEHYRRLSSQKGKARNNELLVMMCLVIEAASGRSHWSDIACLLEASFLSHGKNEDWDADSVRSVVRRFKQDRPIIYREWRDLIVVSPLGSKPQGNPPRSIAKRSTRNRRIAESKPSDPIGY